MSKKRQAAVAAVEAAPEWSGSKDLVKLLAPLDDLELDPLNTRIHDDRNLDVIAASLKKFGQRKPIVVWCGKIPADVKTPRAREWRALLKKGQRVIIAGNGTVAAAGTRLGWKQLAVADASDLPYDHVVAYAIADNKTGDLSEFDFQALATDLRELPEELRTFTAFADFELEPLLAADWNPPGAGSASDDPGHEAGLLLRLTKEQGEVVKRAIDAVRSDGDGPKDASDGRCLELICADFLAGK